MEKKTGLLRSENLSEKVILWFQQRLLNGDFHPGDELPSERELCETLGIGKSSIREALKMLQMAGIVEISQGKKTRISQSVNLSFMFPIMLNLLLQNSSIKELYDFRIMFDKCTTEMAMACAKSEDIIKLREEVRRFESLVKENSATVEDDLAFHKLILDITKNVFVKEIGNIIFQIFVTPLKHVESYNAEKGLADHKKILEAFESNSDKNMEAIMDEVFAYSRDLQ